MNSIQAIILGILQGLTEFLPVSSSGHLVIAQTIIPSFNQPGVLFDVVLHAGTLLAIIFYFRKTIQKINSKYLIMLIIGTIPVVLVGMLFQNQIESLFQSVKLVGFALLITSALNYLTDKKISRKFGPKQGPSLSLLIGVAQAFAIIPGISRSGATIFAGTRLGLKRKNAAEFSFLLSIPAVLGANVLQFITHGLSASVDISTYLAGFLGAFVAGYLSISVVLKLLLTKKFGIFAVYCAIVGISVLLFA